MRFACLLADGFEDVEALATSALLRRAGIEVVYYSVFNKEKVTGAYKTVVTDLLPMKKLEAALFDGLFIPGGRAAFGLREDETVKEIVDDFNKRNKWMMAICAGPTVFGMMGIMDGLHYTSFPGTQEDMGQGIRVDEKAVSDGRFITGKSAGSIYDFVFEIIKAIQGQDALKKFKENIVY